MAGMEEQLLDSINETLRRIDQNTRSFQSKSSSFNVSNVSSGFDDLGKASNSLVHSMLGVAGGLALTKDGFGQLNKSIFNTIKNHKALSSMLGLMGLGIGQTISWLSDSTAHYRNFLNIGQTFNGSFMEMSKIAAESGMSLKDFASVMQQNSGLISTIGVGAFGKISDEVFRSSTEFGNFGLTLNEMNSYLGDYLDTQRVVGINEHIMRVQASANFNTLQTELLALSKVTGKTREELYKSTADRMKADEGYMAYITTLPEEQRAAAMKNIQSADQIFNGLFGPMADTMRDALSNSLRGVDPSVMNEAFAKLTSVFPQVRGQFQAMADAIKANDPEAMKKAQIEMAKSLQNASDEQIKNMAILAKSDQDFKNIIVASGQLAGKQLEKFQEELKKQESLGAIEKASLTFGAKLDKIGAGFDNFIIKFLEPFYNSLNKSAALTKLSEFFDKAFDMSSNKEVEKMFTEAGNFIDEIIDTVGQWSGILKKTATGTIEFNNISDVIDDWRENWKEKLKDGFGKVSGWIKGIFQDLSEWWNGKTINVEGGDGVEVIGGFKDTLSDMFNGMLTGIFGTTDTSDIATEVKEKTKSLMTKLVEFVFGAEEANKMTERYEKLGNTIDNVTGYINGVFDSFGGIENINFDTVKEMLESFVSSLGGIIVSVNSALGKINLDFLDTKQIEYMETSKQKRDRLVDTFKDKGSYGSSTGMFGFNIGDDTKSKKLFVKQYNDLKELLKGKDDISEGTILLLQNIEKAISKNPELQAIRDATIQTAKDGMKKPQPTTNSNSDVGLTNQ